MDEFLKNGLESVFGANGILTDSTVEIGLFLYVSDYWLKSSLNFTDFGT